MKIGPVATTVLAALALTACSGDNGGTPAAGTPGGVPMQPLANRSYLGPLYGTWVGMFSLSCQENACVKEVTFDGEPAAVSDLPGDGEIVQIRSIDPQSVAVDVQHTVIGPVEALDLDAGTLTVLGQHVYLMDQTWTVDLEYETLAIGDTVAVSGALTADGDIYATNLAHSSAHELLLRGVLSAAGTGFRIGGVDVDLSGAVLEGFPATAPVAGDTVLLRGTRPTPGAPIIVRVARLTSARWNAIVNPSGSPVIGTLTGFITAVRSSTDFDIAGYRVDDITCSVCEVGVHVEIRWTLSPMGSAMTFVRQKPLTWASDTVAGPIEAIDIARRTLTVLGVETHVPPGAYIGRDSLTQETVARHFEDPALPLGRHVSLADLQPGDTVAVIGGIWRELFVAGAVVPVGDAPWIIASHYDVEPTQIEFRGRTLSVDPAVLSCDSCGNSSFAALVPRIREQYFPPVLFLNLESAAPPLRVESLYIYWQ